MRTYSYLTHLMLICALLIFHPAEGQRKQRDSRANAAFEAGEYYNAIDLYKNAFNRVSNSEQKAEIYFKIGECYRIIGESRQSELWYGKAIREEYQDPIIYLRYGQMKLINEDYDEALDEFKKYRDLVPDDPRGTTGIESCEAAKQWIENPTGYIVDDMRNFNSRQRDFSPAFVNELFTEVYFTSTREDALGNETHGATGQNFADIFTTTMDRKGKWSVPVPLEALNSEFEDGTPNISSDFSTLYFTRCKKGKNQQLGCQIYAAKSSGASWQEPEPLDILEDSLTVAHPAISNDNLTLYFVSDLPGGIGEHDIWKVTRIADNAPWGEPENLGEAINTPGNELYPYVHPDGTLYFSSDSRVGLGGLDIFKAEQDETGGWIIENMKPPINSPGDDFGIVFEAESERGFFSSSRRGRGNDEIYSFVLPPLNFNVTGAVRDERTDRVLPGSKVRSVSSDGITVETTTGEEGSFRFMLKPNTDYVFIASQPGYLSGKVRESTKGLDQSRDFEVTIYLASTTQVIELPNIFYDFAKWDLRPESMVSLDNLVETLNDNPNVTIELMSHTDSRGLPADNIELSQKRAQSVVDYLISKGISPDRLSAKGYGEAQPKVVDEKVREDYEFLKLGDVLTEDFINQLPSPELQEQAHQVNRRTEFRVLSTDYIPQN
ncbi:MAG: OmpA family protein [Bacteroidales bacterium]|nr:OmpA family protein [Bacteroidales bacterium]MBN2697181.1 OmpA family protein [Bacteroidales bacterium]